MGNPLYALNKTNFKMSSKMFPLIGEIEKITVSGDEILHYRKAIMANRIMQGKIIIES